MKKIKNYIPIILIAVMTVIFYFISKSWFDMDASFNFVLENMDKLPINFQRIIISGFFAVMVGVPVWASKSKSLPWIYIGILIIGTVVGREKFLYYVVFVLSLPAYFLGGCVSIFTSIISFFFSGFSNVGLWIVRICQIIGHIGTISLLAFPGEFFKGMLEESRNSKPVKGSSYSERDFLKEHQEKQKLETLKDIEWELKNRK